MTGSIELARKVFGDFQRAYAERIDGDGTWSISYDGEDDAELDLTGKEVRIGLNVLLSKGLIRRIGMDAMSLSDDGVEVCLHPELLDEYLLPRRAAVASAPNVNISGGHVQIGDNNTQTITYRSILQHALAATEEREDVPAPVAAALRRLHEYPDIEALMADGARRAGEE